MTSLFVEMLAKLRKTDAQSISFSGCSKNAGKTTAMNVLTADWRGHGMMSIGIDGEDADFWLGVPKPRIAVSPGVIFATADRTLPAATAANRVVERTGIPTPLGEIVLAEAETSGFVLLAGIRHKADVREVKSRMLTRGVSRIVIDGSYQRQMSADPGISDGMILATGAVLGGTADEVAMRTMEFIHRIRIPACGDQMRRGALETALELGAAAALLDSGDVLTSDIPGPGGALALLASNPEGIRCLALPGAVPEGFTKSLENASPRAARGGSSDGLVILVQDPTRVFLRASELGWLARRGHSIEVGRPIRLLAIAVNPVNVAGPSIPSADLVKAVAAHVDDIPVLDFVAAAG